MNKLTTEQLMQPRYEVIALYPGCRFAKGDILTMFDETFAQKEDGGFVIDYPEAYPNIFRKMQWFEKRSIEDMPQYVKVNHNNHTSLLSDTIYKTRGWVEYENNASMACRIVGKDDVYRFNTMLLQPSTETEYLSYINKIKI